MDDPKIEEGAYREIFAFSGGIPRRINLVCNRLLLAGFLNEAHVLDAADVEAVAKEIREELGSVGQPGVIGADVHEGAREDHGEPRAPSDLEGSSLDEPGAGQQSSRPGLIDPTQLLARVHRLEKAVSRVLEMLRRRSG
jgi:hypothetical protein